MNIEESASAERGQVMVIMVFGMIVLLVVAGLAIDGGTVFMERRHAQNAADAAALAGARTLAEAVCGKTGVDDAAILAQVIDFVAKNKVSDPESSVRADYVDGRTSVLGPVGGGTIPVGATGISATVDIERSTYFMSLVGIDTSAASAYALAMTGPALVAGGLRPFGVPLETVEALNPGELFTIHFDNKGGDVTWSDTISPTQHRGWMNMAYVWNSGEQPAGFPRAIDESANANVISQWMRNGWDGYLYFDSLWREGARDGDYIHAKPGTMTSAICDAPDDIAFPIPIFDAVPDCETEIPTNKPNCPTQGSGYAYHVVGIVYVEIDECRASPDHEIELSFVEMITGKGMPDLSGPTGFGEAHACDTYTQVVTLWK